MKSKRTGKPVFFVVFLLILALTYTAFFGVENYYGDNKFPELKMCGKTGSAEVSNGRSHAWFVGFSYDKKFPYAIVVCLENGGIGYNDAIPAANKTLQALLKAEK